MEDVTVDELKAEYLARKRKLAQIKDGNNPALEDGLPRSPSEGQLKDSNGKFISFSEAKAEFNRRRGIGTGRESSSDSGMTPDQYQKYQEQRAEFFNRQGKQDPLKKAAVWRERLEKEKQKYGSV